MLKIMDKVELKNETAILPNPCYVQCGDNLELLKSQPNESVNMIYSDILYGTGRNFGEYQDLKPIRSEIESHYLPRLIEMKRVLKQTGCIYLQMDWRIVHWVRCLMDDVFGYDNFLNEIIWCYNNPDNTKKRYLRKHDNILFYKVGDDYTFNVDSIRLPYNKETIARSKRKYGTNGRYSEMVINDKGKVPEDWILISQLKGNQIEYANYPTQKPKELIKRFVLASTNEGDTVADYYLGSGTTAVVCQELNRNFIGCDINEKAIELTKSRLFDGR